MHPLQTTRTAKPHRESAAAGVVANVRTTRASLRRRKRPELRLPAVEENGDIPIFVSTDAEPWRALWVRKQECPHFPLPADAFEQVTHLLDGHEALHLAHAERRIRLRDRKHVRDPMTSSRGENRYAVIHE